VKRLFFAFFLASISVYGSIILATTPTVMNTTDVVNWAQLGADQASVSQTFMAGSSMNDSIVGELSSGPGTILVAGTDWGSGNGVAVGDSLLLTSGDSSANGPLTIMSMPNYGEGAYIEGYGVGQFTANIQAFAGFNSVLDMSVTSDAAGDPLFIGVSDSTAEITKVVFSLTSAAAGRSTGDFVLDSLLIEDRPGGVLPPVVVTQSSVGPEPGTAILLGAALMSLGLKLKRRKARL